MANSRSYDQRRRRLHRRSKHLESGSSRKSQLRAPMKIVFVVCIVLLQVVVSSGDNGQARSSTKPLQANKLRSSISELILNNKPTPMPLRSNQPQRMPFGAGGEYKCARHCLCSVIQVMDKSSGESRANLTQAKCESGQFTDLLTIDRRTQIIHISLPQESQQDSTVDQKQQVSSGTFRMPRLVQFSSLREIVIINLKFEVCDSEVFKRGQQLRRFRLNHNQLMRISNACLRHLDRLVELNLDHNQLEELESALFQSLLSLRSLSIAHNRLSELAAHQFANLSQLSSLNLVGNSFKTINLHLFEPMQSSLRLLVLAKNQIRAFTYTPTQQALFSPTRTQAIKQQQATAQQQQAAQVTNQSSEKGILVQQTAPARVQPFVGVVFKNLIKLNVDENKLERIKSLQLHRFFNVKFLSIRDNNIASIRDKAFNGLRLVELNLAHNQLQTVSKCAFCNATIRRLVLAHNNISLPVPASVLFDSASQQRPLAAASTMNHNDEPPPPPPLADHLALTGSSEIQPGTSQVQAAASSSSQNLLILSQSIFGPLFGHLEYLDLSYNDRLADQLEFLLEPLLRLEYLNLASVGLERSLPAPTLFKNLRLLRYLNVSHNQLDQLVAETVEPLSRLEVLDMSHNKFNELDEYFLVTIDELSALKLVNMGSNPWFCSQCKVAPLYDWILRSPIYKSTCMVSSPLAASELPSDGTTKLVADQPATPDEQQEEQEQQEQGSGYSLLLDNDPTDRAPLLNDEEMDFHLILGGDKLGGDDASNHMQDNMLELDELTRRRLSTSEDDLTIAQTISTTLRSLSKQANVNYDEYCLKCEFPGELRSFNIHELSASDFKFCAGAAPRFAASEPKIGLTMAVVIIVALFCIIIIVIVMYRKKSNTYYPNEDTDHLNGSGGKKPVFSVSSDNEHQYATDYSSPPVSQSYDDSNYSQGEDEEHDPGEEDEEVDEEDDFDEDEEEDDEDFDDEDDEDEELEEEAKGDESRAASSASEAAGAKRLAAAEQERRQQVADYNRNESREQGAPKHTQSSNSIRSTATNLSPMISGPTNSSSGGGSSQASNKGLPAVAHQPVHNNSQGSPASLTGGGTEVHHQTVVISTSHQPTTPVTTTPESTKTPLWAASSSSISSNLASNGHSNQHHHPHPAGSAVSFRPIQKSVESAGTAATNQVNRTATTNGSASSRVMQAASVESASAPTDDGARSATGRRLRASQKSGESSGGHQSPLPAQQQTQVKKPKVVGGDTKEIAGLQQRPVVAQTRQSSLDSRSSTSGSHRRRQAAVKSAQTVDWHSATAGAVDGSAQEDARPTMLAGQQPVAASRRRPQQRANLGRQRFASQAQPSRSTTRIPGGLRDQATEMYAGRDDSGELDAAVAAAELALAGENDDDDDDTNDAVIFQHQRQPTMTATPNVDMPIDAREVAPRAAAQVDRRRRAGGIMSPAVSDATTADSLALADCELDLPEADHEPARPAAGIGGALELPLDASSLEPAETYDQAQSMQRRHRQSRHLRPSATTTTGMRESHSSHSALTQTGGSREMIE